LLRRGLERQHAAFFEGVETILQGHDDLHFGCVTPANLAYSLCTGIPP
jgi:hypothetical protein